MDRLRRESEGGTREWVAATVRDGGDVARAAAYKAGRGRCVGMEWGRRTARHTNGRTNGGRGLAWRYACALLPVRPRLPMWGRRSPAHGHGNIKSNRRHPAPPHHLLPPRHRSPSGVTRTHVGGTVRFCVFPDQNA